MSDNECLVCEGAEGEGLEYCRTCIDMFLCRSCRRMFSDSPPRLGELEAGQASPPTCSGWVEGPGGTNGHCPNCDQPLPTLPRGESCSRSSSSQLPAQLSRPTPRRRARSANPPPPSPATRGPPPPLKAIVDLSTPSPAPPQRAMINLASPSPAPQPAPTEARNPTPPTTPPRAALPPPAVTAWAFDPPQIIFFRSDGDKLRAGVRVGLGNPTGGPEFGDTVACFLKPRAKDKQGLVLRFCCDGDPDRILAHTERIGAGNSSKFIIWDPIFDRIADSEREARVNKILSAIRMPK